MRARDGELSGDGCVFSEIMPVESIQHQCVGSRRLARIHLLLNIKAANNGNQFSGHRGIAFRHMEMSLVLAEVLAGLQRSQHIKPGQKNKF